MKTITFLLIIIFNFKIFASLSPINSINKQNNSVLKVLTFNLGALAPLSPMTTKRVNKFCKIIKKSSYKIVFVQEVWNIKYRRRLKKCGYKYVLDMQSQIGIVTRLKKNLLKDHKLKRLAFMTKLLTNKYGYDTGLVILSKYPLYNKSKLRYLVDMNENYPNDGETLVTKGIIGATINYPTLGKIFIANTHLVAEYKDHHYFKARLKQARMMYSWLMKHSKGSPVIVAGDLNLTPSWSDGSQRYLNADKIWNEFRFNIFSTLHEADLPYGELTTHYSPTKKFDEGFLDHIFVSKQLDPFYSKVVFKQPYKVEDKDKDKDKDKSFKLSDHYGVETSIR